MICMTAQRWLYRSRQFFTALLGKLSAEELSEARQTLGPRLYKMFAELPAQYRYHAFMVYRRVRASGCDNRQVWQAALLHDAGKYDPATGRSVTLWHRVAIVLLKASPPGRRFLEQLAFRGERHGSAGLPGLALYPFFLSKQHTRLGAVRAQEHGASAAVTALIAAHHRHENRSQALLALQMADEQS